MMMRVEDELDVAVAKWDLVGVKSLSRDILVNRAREDLVSEG
jgi:hypothetical protein